MNEEELHALLARGGTGRFYARLLKVYERELLKGWFDHGKSCGGWTSFWPMFIMLEMLANNGIVRLTKKKFAICTL